jgi:hypothetical protein
MTLEKIIVPTSIAIDVSSFTTQGLYWSPYAKGTSQFELLFFN